MRLALVDLPQPYFVIPGSHSSIALGYLAAAVAKSCPGVECDILNCTGMTVEETVACVEDYDICGYGTASLGYKMACEVARRVRARHPGIVQLIGGAHVTITHVHDPVFDVVFLGDAEETLVTFLQEQRQGRASSSYEGVGTTPLDELAFPILRPSRKAPVGSAKTSVALIGSRGCPYRCAFCATAILRPQKRSRSVDNIVAEMNWHVERGTCGFTFFDDDFLTHKGRVREFCEKVPAGAQWDVQFRATEADEDLFALMRQAGCVRARLGIESFDQAVLDALQKGSRVQQTHDALEMAAEVGLPMTILLMIGTPGEAYPATVERNIEGLERHRGHFEKITLSQFMPFPGCAIAAHPERYGVVIKNRDASTYRWSMWVRGDEGPVIAPAYSPVAIAGMDEGQQAANVEAMRKYVMGLSQANRGMMT